MKFLFLFMKLPHQFIKNSDLPVCVNCIHFIENKMNYPYDAVLSNDLGKCKIFGKKDIVTGEIKYEYAELCRLNKEKCHLTGKYYESK